MAIPPQRLADLLTRIDELLMLLLKVEEEQLKLLQLISERVGPPVPAPPIPAPVPPPGVAVVALASDTIIELARELANRILQLPNRVDRIEWDTSITTWKSMRGEGKIKPAKALGFWVEDIGGGFEYTIVREGFESDAKTAEVDDKWDQEFDDILVKGAGAGTALIWYWWRAE
jgi:hypothetical protein